MREDRDLIIVAVVSLAVMVGIMFAMILREIDEINAEAVRADIRNFDRISHNAETLRREIAEMVEPDPSEPEPA